MPESGVPEQPEKRGDIPSLKDILLPKKDAPSTLSAQRANAASVLEAATATPAPATPAQVPPPQPPPPAPPHSPSDVVTLHTYKSDVEDTVRSKHVSVADIAAAQARRREEIALTPQEEKVERAHSWTTIAMGTLIFFLGGLIILYVIFAYRTNRSSLPSAHVPSYIYIDDVKRITFTPSEDRSAFMNDLESTREGTSLALGLIEQLYPAVASTTSGAAQSDQALTTQQFFATIAPNAPDTLARALDPEFTLGVHVFNGNQPFLIFKTESYGQTFAGMLDWESTMYNDLSPLFEANPQQQGIAQLAQSTYTSTSSPSTSNFADRTVENHDARVILDATGNIVLLWTFIDRNTLVITTNEYTLREIITRLSSAPTISVPGQ